MNPPKTKALVFTYGPALLISLVGVVLLFRSLLGKDISQTLWADNFDTPFIYWTVNWVYHILFEAHNPAALWNANSFYPQPLTLAYSDSLLSIQLFYAPLRALGVAPLTGLYLALAATLLISCFLTQLALHQIGGFSPAEIALIVFGTHFCLSAVIYLNHYQLFGFHLIPPFVLFLYLFLRDFRFSHFLAVCLIYVAGVCYATYLAPVLFAFALILSIPMLYAQVRKTSIVQVIKAIGWQSAATAALSALLLYFVQIKPYLAVGKLFPKPPLFATADYSAMPFSFLNGFSIYSFWYKPAGQFYGQWEISYFPGVLLLLCGFLFLIRSVFVEIREYFNCHPLKTERTFRTTLNWFAQKLFQDQGFLIYLFLFFALCIVLSWGPYLRLAPDTKTTFRLPYLVLAKFLPGMDSIRAPGRFGMFIGLPLSVFAVFLFRRLAGWKKWYPYLISTAILLLVIESLTTFPTYAFNPDPQGTYHHLADLIPQGASLLDLPLSTEGQYGNVKVATQQLVGSTFHWGRIVAGYGAKESPEYRLFLDSDQQIQANGESIKPILNLAQEYKIDFLLIHLDQYAGNVRQEWEALVQNCGSKAVRIDSTTVLLPLTHPGCLP